MLRGRNFFRLVLWLLLAPLLVAQNDKRSFDLPADSAEASLKRLALRSGVEVLFATDLVAGVRTNAVKAEVSPLEAANLMLARTGLVAVKDDRTGALLIRREAMPFRSLPVAVRNQTAGGASEATATVSTAAEVIGMSPFVVDTHADRGYQATNAISATKLNTPLYELPFSVSVATEEFIRDLGTPDLQETLRFLANVERTFNPESTGQYTIRGTALGATSIYVNSRLVNNGAADTYNISRIEVAKGPASTTMGVSSAVGVINYLVKKPQADRSFQEFSVRAGTQDDFRATFDLNIPYKFRNRPGGLRIMGVYEDSKNFIPFVSRKTRGVTLTNLTKLTDTLTLDIYAESLVMDRIQSSTLAEANIGNVGARQPFGSGGGWNSNLRDINGAVIPLERPVVIGGVNVSSGAFVSGIYDLIELASIGGPENGQDFGSNNFDVALTWQPSSDLGFEAFYSAGRQYKYDIRKEGTTTLRFSGVNVVGGVPVWDPAGGRYFQRQFVTYQPQLPVWRHYGRVSGFYNLDLRWMKQAFRYGVEAFDQGDRRLELSRITTPNTLTSLQLDTYLDDITAATTSITRWYSAGGVRTPIQHSLLPDQSYQAAYITAQGRYWGDRIRTAVGFRRDEARQRSWASYPVPLGGRFSDDPRRPTSDIRYKANSPLYSISFSPVKAINLYYNRAESFSFNQAGAPLLKFNGTANEAPATVIAEGRFDPNDAGDQPPPPETGKGEEFGVKVSLLGGRLSATLAHYTNERINIRTNWPSSFIQGLLGATDPRVSQGFTVAGVVQEASGWEFELQASPNESLTFALSYSEPELMFTHNPANPNSVGVPNVSNFRETFNLLGRYTVTTGALKGLMLGTSVQYRGPFLLTTNMGGFYSPGYTICNPFFAYELAPGRRFQVDFRIDVRNIFDTDYAVSHIIGEPRSILFSTNIRFK